MATDRDGGGGYRAVLFDFGGVLTTPVWDSFSAFCRDEGLDPDTVKNLFRTDPQALADLRGLERGEVSESEFEARFGARLGLKNHERLIDSMFAGMRPLDRMLQAVRAMRAGSLRTGLVSNSWSVDHYDRELLAELFDDVVISAEVRLHKPQREIYVLAAERIGAPPAACVFVDDLRENCEGAEAAGMTAIRHREPEKTIARLNELTGVAVPPAVRP
ncbi:MAG TPA: HAD family phosphatase [Solirubrobacterales bacterium]|jgi:epoxide hydrolase-like predicted phosphatase|nr:HAD family phosphatase [Solirubrobacterales bacterium]